MKLGIIIETNESEKAWNGARFGTAGVCPISTMVDCVDMVEWADKVVTF